MTRRSSQIPPAASGDGWTTVAPLLPYRDKARLLRETVELAAGVILGPLPPWAASPEIIDRLFAPQADRLRESRFAFSFSYPAKSLGDPHPGSTDEHVRSWQQYASKIISFANIALWITKPTSIGYELLCHFERPGDGRITRQIEVMKRILVHPQDEDAQLTVDDLATARCLHAALLALAEGTATANSIKYLYKALLEALFESRYVFFWIVLESLFGASDAREITYRLSHRIAHFLGRTGVERRKLFASTKDAYAWRSKVVHGAKLRKLKAEKANELAAHVETVIRRSYLRIVPDEALVRRFDGTSRERYLDELSLGGPAQSLPG